MSTKAELEAEIAALKAKLVATDNAQQPAVPQENTASVAGADKLSSANKSDGNPSDTKPVIADAAAGPGTSRAELEMRIADKIYSDVGFRYHQTIMMFRLIYSVCGLFLGLACVIGGVALFFGGITGATKWTAKILGASSDVSDAAPGAVLFIVGLFIVIATRFKARAISSALPFFR